MLNGSLLWVFIMMQIANNAGDRSVTIGSSGSTQGGPRAAAASQPAGFLFRSLAIGKETFNYSIYVPPEYSAEQAWPVILSLHGSGERGNDGLLQTEVGIGTAIRRNRALCPAIVVMPQCRAGQAWVGAMAEMAVQCLEQTMKEYRIDADRVYLTGLSLGGYGAWLIAERAPQRFAAVLPICGFYGQFGKPADAKELQKLVEATRALPIWTFHGAKDTAVAVQRTQEIVKAYQDAGVAVKFTEYPDGQHDVWNRVYADAEVWKWMLGQRRGAAAASSRPATP